MKICLAQLNYRIGDFEQNTAIIADTIQEARLAKADLVVFSELAICGYPPEDLLDYPGFIDHCEQALDVIAAASSQIAVLVGGISHNKGPGRKLFNSAIWIENGEIKYRIHKQLLPTYDVFNEARYFEPGFNTAGQIIEYRGIKLGVAICEDLWDQYNDFSYSISVVEQLKNAGAQCILHPSASPYSFSKERLREKVFLGNTERFELPILYVNQVGAHAEIIFDGRSRVVNSKGETLYKAAAFTSELIFVQIDSLDGLVQVLEADSPSAEEENSYPDIADLHHALVFGIKDFFKKNGVSKALVGSSGGIDSAVVQALASIALGPEQVTAVLMPSEYSSEGSVTDAKQLSENLGNPFHILPIHQTYQSLLTTLQPAFAQKPFDVTEENLQARIRGVMLMAMSNKHGGFLLNTSNKSEMAVGYSTLYGDMCGSLSVIGDVWKTKVYQLAKYINRNGEVIPHAILTKAPSAELRPGQKDADTLPEYDLLDDILKNYVERRLNSEEIIALGFDAKVVKRVLAMVDRNEYKRWQAPPILRVSEKAFGKGRQMPLVAKYDS